MKEIEAGSGERPDIARLELQLETAKKDASSLQQELATAMDQAASHAQAAKRVQADLEALGVTLQQYQADLAGERRRIERALETDGHTWTEKVLANAREFRSLDPEVRRTPIISVLNLKGGVGKTTITGNLGAALDAMGYRTLLLDLDLQGSLTSLFLPETQQESLFQSQRMLGDFLAASYTASPNLNEYMCPILPDGKSALVPTTDYLAYAEMNLTVRWLLRERKNDPRFLLRKELQLRRITNTYDIILLDCPPLINISCVNALAASDYVLIPILPSKQATARVPVLLERLREFRQNINHDLKVMGIICNRTHRSELTADEENRLSLLRVQCHDVWGENIPQFDTFIQQSKDIRAAEDEKRPLRPDDTAFEAFAALAKEVESRLPNFCRTPSAAGAKAEVMS